MRRIGFPGAVVETLAGQRCSTTVGAGGRQGHPERCGAKWGESPGPCRGRESRRFGTGQVEGSRSGESRPRTALSLVGKVYGNPYDGEWDVNYTMGRYIGELDAEGRDRLIGAPEFATGGSWLENGCGCLCGTAMGIERDSWWDASDDTMRLSFRLLGSCSTWRRKGPAWRFPAAVRRFGKARVVRAVKLRAARLNGSSAEHVEAILSVASEASGKALSGGGLS